MKVVVFGSGYVGLVSGVCLAELGHDVTCVDIDKAKIDLINAGISPIYEEGLTELLRKNVSANNLRATSDYADAMNDADVSIIAVGTPFDGEEIDLTNVRQAANNIGVSLKGLTNYHVVCVKSTVIPGTTDDVVGPIIEECSGRKLGESIGLCMNPEFLAEGTAVEDSMNPDRIVIGAIDEHSSTVFQSIFASFVDTDFVLTSPSTAEMCKYAANSFLATVISFSNELSNLCLAIGGVDTIDVLNAVHLDKRLSPLLPEGRITPGLMSFLLPGTGFGGSCFPKDVKALTSFGARIGQPMQILDAVLETNNRQSEVTIGLVLSELGTLEGKRIAILGLSFKPGTDDVRESPALAIIKSLLDQGASVKAHDPVAISSMKSVLADNRVSYCTEFQETLDDIDAIILVTSWPEYKDLHIHLASKSIPVIDGRRFLDKRKFDRYRGIGFREIN